MREEDYRRSLSSFISTMDTSYYSQSLQQLVVEAASPRRVDEDMNDISSIGGVESQANNNMVDTSLEEDSWMMNPGDDIENGIMEESMQDVALGQNDSLVGEGLGAARMDGRVGHAGSSGFSGWADTPTNGSPGQVVEKVAFWDGLGPPPNSDGDNLYPEPNRYIPASPAAEEEKMMEEDEEDHFNSASHFSFSNAIKDAAAATKMRLGGTKDAPYRGHRHRNDSNNRSHDLNISSDSDDDDDTFNAVPGALERSTSIASTASGDYFFNRPHLAKYLFATSFCLVVCSLGLAAAGLGMMFSAKMQQTQASNDRVPGELQFLPPVTLPVDDLEGEATGPKGRFTDDDDDDDDEPPKGRLTDEPTDSPTAAPLAEEFIDFTDIPEIAIDTTTTATNVAFMEIPIDNTNSTVPAIEIDATTTSPLPDMIQFEMDLTTTTTEAPPTEETAATKKTPWWTKAPPSEETDATTEATTQAPDSTTSTTSTSTTTSEPTPSPTKDPTTSEPTPTPTKEPITSEPTPSPTKYPTTSEPTPSPTNDPTTSKPTPLSTTPAPTTCEGRKWHFTMSNGCTNTVDVKPDAVIVYGTLDQCCTARFGENQICISNDICSTASPSKGPTASTSATTSTISTTSTSTTSTTTTVTTPTTTTDDLPHIYIPGDLYHLTLNPIADTWLEFNDAQAFGDKKRLKVDGNIERITLLKFDLSTLASQYNITSGRDIVGTSLRLFSMANSPFGGKIDLLGGGCNGWGEYTISWNNAPECVFRDDVKLVGQLGIIPAENTWNKANMNIHFGTKLPTRITLRVTSHFDNGVTYASRENEAAMPELLVYYTLPEDEIEENAEPTTSPVEAPTKSPTPRVPTKSPIESPSKSPMAPTGTPTYNPTEPLPTYFPTTTPTLNGTASPTIPPSTTPQELTIPVSQDATLRGGDFAKRAFGRDPFNTLRGSRRKTILEFDLSETRPNFEYEYKLQLFITYVAQTEQRSVAVSYITQDYEWNEEYVTWDSFGIPLEQEIGWFSIFNTDSETLVEIPLGKKLNSTVNNGKLILILQNVGDVTTGGDKFDFRSKEFATVFPGVADTPPTLIGVPQLS